MSKRPIASSQVTIQSLNDAYTIHQSITNYVFATSADGIVTDTTTIASVIKVQMGEVNVPDFTIGNISKPNGFTAITVNNVGKTITFSVAKGTNNLADTGIINIPVIIKNNTYNLSFAWSKAKQGIVGPAGIDANLLDWVSDWNTNKTVIGSDSVITPKIFAGVKNTNGTLTGIALGRFPIKTTNKSGTVISETIDGIYGFKDGNRTFFVDNTGNVQLGNDLQSIKYNALAGKIEFGSEVSLNWLTPIEIAKNEAVSSAANDAAQKVNAIQIGTRNYIRRSAFNVSNIKDILATNGVTAIIDTTTKYQVFNSIKITQTTATGSNAASYRVYFNALKLCSPASFSMWVKASEPTFLRIRIGGSGALDKAIDTEWKLMKLENITPTLPVVLFGATTSGVSYNIALPMLVEGTKATDWSPAPEDIESDVEYAQSVADAITQKANDEKWGTKLTYIDSTGIFTGTLSANTVNAVRINASQITVGVIDTARINVAELKSTLITASNIESLNLDVVQGKIGGWNIDADSIFSGTKNNGTGGYTNTPGSMTIGSQGIRGFKWKFDSDGAGAVAGGNISWDTAGNVTFSPSVILNWTTPINNIIGALGGSSYPKLTQISSTGIYTGSISAEQITAGIINADRIASGSITSLKLDAASIKANIINTDYINGLSCTFIQGLIGGWTIASDTIYNRKNGKSIIIRSGEETSMVLPDYGRKGVTLYIDDNVLDTEGVKIVQMGDLPKRDTVKAYTSEANYGFRITLKGGKDIFRADKDGAIIADWKIDEDSIYRGTKNNTITGYTQGVGYMTIGSNGIRGYKWRLESNGSGSIGGGNISWDILGNITFAPSVQLNWTNYTDNLIATTNNNILPKLTQITSSGIYTGTLEASQITAGTISADRIASGSITSLKLDASSIKANIINTDYINGLSCTFSKGIIGGWNILSDTIYQGISGKYIFLRATEGISPVLPHYARRGLTIYMEDESIPDGSVKIIQMGMLTDKNSAQNYPSIPNYGFRIMLKGSRDVFRADQSGVQLAGWNVDYESISRGTKSNQAYAFTPAGASITIGTRGIRGYQWRLESDGSGAIAGGNITWNTLGKVTFADSVSLNWTKYTDTKVDSINVGARNYALETSNAWSLYTNLSNVVNQCIFPYKVLTDMWKKGDTVLVTFDYKYSNIVADPSQICLISMQGSGDVTGWGVGGFNSVNIIDKIDFLKKSGTIRVSYSFVVTADHLYNSYFNINIRHDYLTGRVYIKNLKVEKGTKITDWSPAPEDFSSRLTRITSTGIYTGTVSASQINVDNTLIVGGSTYNGNISVRDASNSTKVTLDRSGITAVGGSIGGWTISSNQISKNSVVFGADGTISNGGKWKLGNDGAGYVANGNVVWTETGAVTITGTINATSGQIGGFEISYGRIGSVATGYGEGGGLAIYDDLFRVGSSDSYVLFGSDTFPASAGGAFTSTGRITNHRSSSFFFDTNCGIYIDVKNAPKNYGIYSNAPIIAPSIISSKCKTIVFSGTGYSIDFSQCNLFFVYGTAHYGVNLPDESSVTNMFGYSTLPSDFAYIFTLVYNYNYGNKLTINNLRDNNGNLTNYDIARGDSLTILCAKYPSFHYQVINHYA